VANVKENPEHLHILEEWMRRSEFALVGVLPGLGAFLLISCSEFQNGKAVTKQNTASTTAHPWAKHHQSAKCRNSTNADLAKAVVQLLIMGEGISSLAQSGVD
jgi:hypothetical protein